MQKNNPDTINVDDVRKTLNYFFKPDEVFEIRIIGKVAQPGYFNDQNEAVMSLSAYLKSLSVSNAQNVNVYFCLNPFNPALLSRSVKSFQSR
jgi:hypothetical protein